MTRVPIPAWTAPWPVHVDERFLRVSASHLRGEERWECPTQIAAKARPALRVAQDTTVRPVYAPFEQFTLGIARDAAYDVLARNADPQDALAAAAGKSMAAVADASLSVAREALTGYLIAVARLRDSGELPPDALVREFFAVDEANDDHVRVEWYAWGLLHISPDGAFREFHVLTWEEAGTRDRGAAYLAVCARAAVDAVVRAEGHRWRESWTAAPRQPGAPERIRVREVGMLDSTDAVLLEMSADEVRAEFPARVGDHLRVLGGQSFNPGSRCATCTARSACPGIARMPGVLGVAGPSQWTRGLSPSDLTAARVCTWQTHLERELSLPRARRETPAAMRRGIRLHAWLEHAHGRLVACSADDLPLPAEGVGEVGDLLGWSPEEYAALRPYLLQHLGACPLRRDNLVAAYPEQGLTAWDTDVEVIMSTRADLVVETSDSFILRETKSVAEASAPDSAVEVFERYPQVAVALCMLADGLDPLRGDVAAEPRRAYVELELLSEHAHEVRSFDAGSAEVVLLARAVVADAVDRILYTPAEPNPGHWCAWCPVARWCEARAGLVHAEPEAVGDAGLDDVVTVPSRVALLAYAEDISTVDDDIPY